MSDIDVLVSEVGPRDGLQSIDSIMSTDDKKKWIKAESEAGVREIEVGSFVRPDLLPQMADTAEIVQYAKSLPNLTVAALVPNFKGAKNAIDAGVDKMCLPLSVSETHSKANLNKSHEEVLAEIEQIVSAGTKVNIDHCIEESMDEDCVEELFEFFSESEDESIEAALSEFGDSYSEEELRLIRIKFLSDIAN